MDELVQDIVCGDSIIIGRKFTKLLGNEEADTKE